MSDPNVSGPGAKAGGGAAKEKPRSRTRRKCPICGKPPSEDAFPFCSKRCANIDLNRWLSGSYVIPAAPDEPAEDGAAEE